jgi:peptide subunit release factor 1 (eRF1)
VGERAHRRCVRHLASRAGFDEISHDTGKYCFGVDDTIRGLEMGAVETLIVWENLAQRGDPDRGLVLVVARGRWGSVRIDDVFGTLRGKYCFGVDDTIRGLEMGAVETLIVWENLDVTRHANLTFESDSAASSIAWLKPFSPP